MNHPITANESHGHAEKIRAKSFEGPKKKGRSNSLANLPNLPKAAVVRVSKPLYLRKEEEYKKKMQQEAVAKHQKYKQERAKLESEYAVPLNIEVQEKDKMVKSELERTIREKEEERVRLWNERHAELKARTDGAKAVIDDKSTEIVRPSTATDSLPNGGSSSPRSAINALTSNKGASSPRSSVNKLKGNESPRFHTGSEASKPLSHVASSPKYPHSASAVTLKRNGYSTPRLNGHSTPKVTVPSTPKSTKSLASPHRSSYAQPMAIKLKSSNDFISAGDLEKAEVERLHLDKIKLDEAMVQLKLEEAKIALERIKIQEEAAKVQLEVEKIKLEQERLLLERLKLKEETDLLRVEEERLKQERVRLGSTLSRAGSVPLDTVIESLTEDGNNAEEEKSSNDDKVPFQNRPVPETSG